MKEFELTKESLEKFLTERKEFMSDKCPDCMRYLNNQNQCEYNFCMSKLK